MSDRTTPTLEQHLMDKLEILLQVDDPFMSLHGAWEMNGEAESLHMSISRRELRAIYDGLLMLRDDRTSE
jgi:hypothetical protein